MTVLLLSLHVTLYLLGPTSCQPDSTGAIVGGVVVILFALILAVSITAIVIAYLAIVLKQRRTGGLTPGVNLK